MSLRFKKPKQKLPVSSNDQGLTKDNTVKLKGKNPGEKKKKKKSSPPKLLKLGKSTYPDGPDPHMNMIRRMARGSDSDSISSRDTRKTGKSSKKSKASSLKSSTPLHVPKPPSTIGPSMGDDDDLSISSFDSDDEGPPMIMPGMDDDAMSVSTMTSSIHSLDKTISRMRSNQPQAPTKNAFGMSDAEAEQAEKRDILARLHILKQRGTRLSKNYTTSSTLNELRMEMGRLEHEAETTRTVQRLRRWLLAGVSGMEYASNSKYSPRFAKGKLNGFSTYVVDSIEDYDHAFERMGEQYGGVMGIGSTGNPLTDIFMLMLTQAFMFIFIEHKIGAKPPTADEIKKDHPDLIRTAAREMAEKMRQEERQQEMEVSRAREEARQAWLQQFHTPAQEHHGVSNGLAQMMQGMAPAQVTAQPPMQEYRSSYTAPPQQQLVQQPTFKPEPVVSKKKGGMPPPSIMKPPSISVPSINTEDTSLFDLKPPVSGNTLETTFTRTQPEGGDASIPPSMPPRSASPFPQPEKLPEIPFKEAKSVEMPTTTRPGKQVKINTPKKSSSEEKSNDDAKSITIG